MWRAPPSPATGVDTTSSPRSSFSYLCMVWADRLHGPTTTSTRCAMLTSGHSGCRQDVTTLTTEVLCTDGETALLLSTPSAPTEEAHRYSQTGHNLQSMCSIAAEGGWCATRQTRHQGPNMAATMHCRCRQHVLVPSPCGSEDKELREVAAGPHAHRDLQRMAACGPCHGRKVQCCDAVGRKCLSCRCGRLPGVVVSNPVAAREGTGGRLLGCCGCCGSRYAHATTAVAQANTAGTLVQHDA